LVDELPEGVVVTEGMYDLAEDPVRFWSGDGVEECWAHSLVDGILELGTLSASQGKRLMYSQGIQQLKVGVRIGFS
jgi:hypothetical protein